MCFLGLGRHTPSRELADTRSKSLKIISRDVLRHHSRQRPSKRNQRRRMCANQYRPLALSLLYLHHILRILGFDERR